MSFCFPFHPFIYCVCSGSVFLSTDYPAGLSAGSAFLRFLALKPYAAQSLCKNFFAVFLRLTP
ncbi:hypothetical protein [Campylobacter magnus]|uniref:hypothetical protein n=1 Tax=Campylobacter magnus TaxID=3026462 RepID=UPI00236228D8|nr:hypothetical protein [Campylobacter magnus]MDD0856569.1 hypothetical protein [Campylobacter magnus]